MLQSQLFSKTLKEAPKDEKSVNAQFLIRGGFADKLMAGVYNMLPLGWRVFKKIENIIREEINEVGGQEIYMPTMHPKEHWDKTGRWQDLEVLYRLEEEEIAFGPTHEEIVSPLAKKFIRSYKDLPVYVYQIQNKFRKELRAKSGLLRGREFVMKDLYSFHASEADLDAYYKIAHDAYLKIFTRLGLQAFSVEASGGAMSANNSHEFMVKTEAGEDLTIFCESCAWAQNTEITKLKDGDSCPNCAKKLKLAKTVEAGNIFRLYTKYSKDMDLKFTDADGKQQLVLMGCYGIGLSRIMGTVVEASHDADGIIWTKNTTPYQVHLLNLVKDDKSKADKLYADLQAEGVEVLYDDRDLSFGKKLKDADLIGICLQVIVSDKQTDLELKDRQTNKTKLLAVKDLLVEIKKYYK